MFQNDDLHLLLTQRSQYLRLHSNDVSFPGGKWEPGDQDEVQTCLRETREEIGLDTSAVDIVGKLYPMLIPRGPTVIVPVVGVIPPDFKVTLSSEVTHVFSLPLRRFLSSRGHRLVERYEPSLDRSFSLHCFTDTVDGVVFDTWGFTAHNIMRLAGAILQEPAEYVSWVHIDDPFQEHRQRFEEQMETINSK